MVPARPRRPRTETLEQPRQPVLRVAHDRKLGLEELADHGRVEVEVDQGLRRLEREVQEKPLGRSVSEAAADGEDHVGRFDDRVGRAPVRQDAVPQRIPLADRSPAHHRGNDRRAQAAREADELGLRPGGDNAAAGDEQRLRGAAEEPRRPRGSRPRGTAVAVRARRCAERRRSARSGSRWGSRSRSDRAVRSATGRTRRARSAESPKPRVTASAQRVTGLKHSIWFGTSWSAPMSRPTRADATSDITTTTGIDPAYDSTSGVSAFVAPGPVVTMTTPGDPAARA